MTNQSREVMHTISSTIGEAAVAEDAAAMKSRLILGNGASELIDLVTRLAAPAGGFQQGSSTVQYKAKMLMESYSSFERTK